MFRIFKNNKGKITRDAPIPPYPIGHNMIHCYRKDKQMKKTLEFIKEPINYICDPGHGWIAIPMEVIKELAIEDKISSYSYKRKGIAYLEEDWDAGIFLEAVKEKCGVSNLNISQKHQDNESIIRTFDRF